MAKFYLAAPYPEQAHALAIAQLLCYRGHTSTARWLTESSVNNDEGARNDLADVDAADVLVALNPEGYANAGTGGRHVEFGYAYARKIPIVLFGARTNIFHHLDDVAVVETLEELIAHVQTIPSRR